MRSNPKETKRRKRTIRVWTYDEATAAVPYIAAVVRSLREHWLDAASKRQLAAHLDARPGRPDRAMLIAKAEALKDAREAEDRYFDARNELSALDIFCIEPARGEALVAFVYENKLAWFVFDLFDPKPFRFWRYHEDPLDTRRPIVDVIAPTAKSA
jgi:hypothetical protein